MSDQPSVSDNSRTKSLWRALWKLSLPWKVKIFFWHLLHNSIPTGTNLVRRHLIAVPKCCVCGFVGENDVHVFLQCWWANCIWDISGFLHGIDRSRFTSSDDLLYFCFTTCDKEKWRNIILTMWYIWFARNRMLHENVSLNPFMACKHIHLLSKEYLNPSNMYDPYDAISGSVHISPRAGCFRINVDGAWNADTRLGGWAVIVTNSEGLIMAARYGYQVKAFSNGWMETFAMKEGLKLAEELKLEDVLFESDYCAVVQQLLYMNKVGDEVYELLNVCRDLYNKYDRWNVKLISREDNYVADYVAKKAKVDCISWCRTDACPSFLRNALYFSS